MFVTLTVRRGTLTAKPSDFLGIQIITRKHCTLNDTPHSLCYSKLSDPCLLKAWIQWSGMPVSLSPASGASSPGLSASAQSNDGSECN